ncbi:MAG TPA: cyanophycin synthetase, partial [Bacteroidia bacterium]|nr:cyanophycin synthetase [Bacteroidia bacterium]
RLPGVTEVVKPKLSGEYNFQNILAAGSIGFYFGVEPGQVKGAVESYQPTNNRSQVMQKGTNMLFMDCYNANPSSMEVALRNFASFDAENKVVVVGDMFELGEHAPAEHEAIARLCRELEFKDIYSVGPLFAPYSIIMGSKHYMSVGDLKDHFVLNPLKNSYILFKASRGIALEKAAEGIV